MSKLFRILRLFSWTAVLKRAVSLLGHYVVSACLVELKSLVPPLLLFVRAELSTLTLT
jgi:hypothetical protein